MHDDRITALRERWTAGEGAALAAVGVAATDSERRALWLLSIGLVLPPDEIARLARLVWPQADTPNEAVEAIARWAFVAIERRGWRVVDGVAQQLASQFRGADPDGFTSAHRLLAEREQDQELLAGDDEDASWFIRGRIAYYLAGVDAQQSADLFTSTFVHAPDADRIGARIWLTSLALHQRLLLIGHDREMLFFQGFRSYATGAKADARGYFEAVVAMESPGDEIEAIASHLLGVLCQRDDIDRGIRLLERAKQVSDELGLDTTGAMATDSLAWAHVRKSDDLVRSPTSQDAELMVANALADENLRSATSARTIWARNTWASIRWLALTRSRARVTDAALVELPHLAETLRGAARDSVEAANASSALICANMLAQMLRDGGDYEQALAEVEEVLDALAWMQTLPPVLVKRLAQSVASGLSAVDNKTVRVRAGRLLTRLDKLQARSSRLLRGLRVEDPYTDALAA